MADFDPQKPKESVPASPEKKEEPVSDLELKDEASQNLLKSFEVEAMPESNELQERRRRTKNRLQELADVKPEAREATADEGDMEGGGLMDLLKEANLTPRHLKFCCGGVLVVLVLGGLIYGLVKGFGSVDIGSWWEDLSWGSDEPATPEQPETPVSDDEDPGDSATSVYPDPSIAVGMLIGESETSGMDEPNAGENIGLDASTGNDLEDSINDFSRVYEAVQVDVNELLNDATDRREALKDYEDELGYLLSVARRNQDRLADQLDLLEEQFSKQEDLKDAQEEFFFDRLADLDAYSSGAALDEFIAYSQEVIRLRAHFQARERLLGFYENVIPVVETKLRDLELNEEALVKGVTVIQVDGSDLDLVIDEGDL